MDRVEAALRDTELPTRRHSAAPACGNAPDPWLVREWGLSMEVEYSVTRSGELVIADGGGVRWRGHPDGYRAKRVVPVPEVVDAIVLLEYSADGAPRQFANIVRIDPDGRIAWRAAPPRPEDVESDEADFLAGGGEDAWVAARWEKRRGLSANSFSCFYCRLDPDTGRITSATFTK